MKTLEILQKRGQAALRIKVVSQVKKFEQAYKQAQRDVNAANERLGATSRAKKRAVEALAQFDARS